MSNEFRMVFLKQLWRYMKTEVDSKQEIYLQSIHLTDQDTSNLWVVRIIVVGIIKEFSSQKNRSNDNTVNIQFCEQKVVSLDQSINVNKRQDEAFIWTWCVFVNAGVV